MLSPIAECYNSYIFSVFCELTPMDFLLQCTTQSYSTLSAAM